MTSRDERVRRAFAALATERSAPAQISIGLIGRGIGSSLSPIMHETEARRLGIDYRYRLVDFDRLGLEDGELPKVIETACAQGYAGLNVTYPFKQAIIPLLDELSAEASVIGAVNTVVLRSGKRVGHNTDCWGFAESFRRGLENASVACVVQFGAGGAGAAVAQALIELGTEELIIVDTESARAQSLAKRLHQGNGVKVLEAHGDETKRTLRRASGVVNATPVGMEKYPGMPFDTHLLNPNQWMADVVYFPRETELIRYARSIGCRVLPGGGMAVFQAVRAFELFTGLVPDSTAMERTFEAAA